MTQRDPRTDPRPGDVLTNGKDTFYVTGVRNGMVTYTDAPPVEPMQISTTDWRTFSKTDMVVRTGEE